MRGCLLNSYIRLACHEYICDEVGYDEFMSVSMIDLGIEML